MHKYDAEISVRKAVSLKRTSNGGEGAILCCRRTWGIVEDGEANVVDLGPMDARELGFLVLLAPAMQGAAGGFPPTIAPRYCYC